MVPFSVKGKFFAFDWINCMTYCFSLSRLKTEIPSPEIPFGGWFNTVACRCPGSVTSSVVYILCCVLDIQFACMQCCK